MSETPKLLPCAHCGDSPMLSQLGRYLTAECSACNIRTAERLDPSEVLEQWNRRALPDSVKALVEAAKTNTGVRNSGYVEPLVYEIPFAGLRAAIEAVEKEQSNG